MNTLNCEYVRDLLPELLSGRLDTSAATQVRAHIEDCAECRLEQGIAQSVAGSRLELPAGLEQRVRLATAGRRVSGIWSRGRMAAAASVAVAVIGGSALLAPYLNAPSVEAPIAVAAEVEGAGWFGVEDAFNSGASSLTDLTDDELKQLLVELK